MGAAGGVGRFFGRAYRKTDRKSSPLIQSLAVRGNTSPVGPDDGLRNRQPQPKPSKAVVINGPCSNGRKIRSMFSVEMPIPVSFISTTMESGSGLKVRTLICPSGGVNLMAFFKRLQKTCWSRPGSPRAVAQPAAASSSRATALSRGLRPRLVWREPGVRGD